MEVGLQKRSTSKRSPVLTLMLDKNYTRHLLAQSLFNELPRRELDCMLALSSERSFRAGQLIFQKGDRDPSVMAVLRGRVRIGLFAESGKEITLDMIDPGGLVGESSLLDGRGRTASATAMEDCILLSIHRRDFVPFLERHPKIAMRLLAIVCERLGKTNAMLETVAFLDPSRRLSRLLLSLADVYGKPSCIGVLIDIRLSQKDLGNLVATSREAVNKQLRFWKDEDIIATHEGCIVIRDRRALELNGRLQSSPACE